MTDEARTNHPLVGHWFIGGGAVRLSYRGRIEAVLPEGLLLFSHHRIDEDEEHGFLRYTESYRRLVHIDDVRGWVFYEQEARWWEVVEYGRTFFR